ncbi:TraR/DksA C4-type zinc finger protein [bacterium]|nr:TraR/DksA C4-type zinc finger protein [FCB group bacterium]MBL7190171.1 TraR/DksA C4-type zinc finger protein [bacterium]
MTETQSGFSPEELQYFKDLIIEKREMLVKELTYLKEASLETSLNAYSGNHSTYTFHMADQGTDAQEREKAFMFAHREKRFLDHLDRALDRIKDGSYGICMECGELIAKPRLEAVPHARLCIKCKQEEEGKR